LNLAVMDGAVQLRALQNTINLFQDKEFQSDIRKLKLQQLKKVFVDKWKPES
jgi:PTS system galactitol-specific IIA component